MKNFKSKPIVQTTKPGIKGEPVTTYMTKDLITFKRDTPILEVVDVLFKHRISGAPVLDERDNLVGLIDDKDCLRVIVDSAYYNMPISRDRAEHYMTNVMKTVHKDASTVEVANMFLSGPYKRFPVVDDKGKLIGQISRRDILKAIKEMDISTNRGRQLQR